MKKPFSRFVLKNGLTVFLVPTPESIATTFMVLARAGSKYETKDNNGISHFLEHMMFKGTISRPSAMQISSELDGVGAQYNAFTGHEMTAYYAKVKNEFSLRALDIISDLYLNPIFDEKEIEKEKGVIVEEINMYEDLPQRKVQELFMQCVYGDQAAGWPIAGSRENVRSFGREDFLRYRRAHYVPEATVVVVAGGFSPRETLAFLRKQFSRVPSGRKSAKKKVLDTQAKPAELVFSKESDQTHLVLGFRAFSLFDERKYALQVLTDALGGGMSSRLFHRIREEMGAAYYVRATDDLYSDHGLISMSAGVTHAKTKEVVQAGLEEFSRFCKEKISKEELAKAKDHIIGTFSLSLETSDELGLFYATQEILKTRIMRPEEVARKIRAVSAEDVQAVARALFRANRLNFAAVGPFKQGEFGSLLKI